MKVYVVVGTTGEYSDRIEWQVCAYRDEEQAKAHVQGAEGYVRANYQTGRPRLIGGMVYEVPDGDENPWDPELPTYAGSVYTGVSYSYSAVELRNTVPSVVEIDTRVLPSS